MIVLVPQIAVEEWRKLISAPKKRRPKTEPSEPRVPRSCPLAKE
jgi:hypothetical protein